MVRRPRRGGSTPCRSIAQRIPRIPVVDFLVEGSRWTLSISMRGPCSIVASSTARDLPRTCYFLLCSSMPTSCFETASCTAAAPRGAPCSSTRAITAPCSGTMCSWPIPLRRPCGWAATAAGPMPTRSATTSWSTWARARPWCTGGTARCRTAAWNVTTWTTTATTRPVPRWVPCSSSPTAAALRTPAPWPAGRATSRPIRTW